MSRRTILLAVAMTIFGLNSSAKAYTMERVDPVEESLSGPLGWGRGFTARFGGIIWPANWDYAEWYVDGALQETRTIGGQAAESTFHWGFHTPGTVGIKVRAQYNVLGSPTWTDYLTWTIEVYAHPPSAFRVSPDSPVTVQEGGTQAFTASATDPLGSDDIERVDWYLDDVPQAHFEFDPFPPDPQAPREHTWSHTFGTPGNYLVEAVFYDRTGSSSGSGEAEWTVEVEDHKPSGTIVSPSSPVTAYTGVPVQFTLAGTDPADDLQFCEVSLDGVLQTHAYFGGSASGSTATWTHTFNAPGMHRVVFVPFDVARNSGSAEEWIVVVEPQARQAGLNVAVIGLDARGRPQGLLPEAKVDLTGPGAIGLATTDGDGRFAFTGMSPGTYTVDVSSAGYYAQSRSVSWVAGETKHEIFRLMPESAEPMAFDFTSPDGKHFIGGLPGNLSFNTTVVWNGSPGSVHFNVLGIPFTPKVTDLGGGMARASLAIPAPPVILSCTEWTIKVTNGEGKTALVRTGVYFYPVLDIITLWYTDRFGWQPLGSTFQYNREDWFQLWDMDIGTTGSCNAGLGGKKYLCFDPFAGTYSGSFDWYGTFGMEMRASGVEVLGENRVGLGGALSIGLIGCDNPPEITPSWTLSLSGKSGVGLTLPVVIDGLIPPAAPATAAIVKVPGIGDALVALKVRMYLIVGGSLSGEYEPGKPAECFLGTTSLSGSLTLGLEGQLLVEVKRWFVDLSAGVYAGVTGTPEFQLCPDFEFTGVTVRGYVGVFASAWMYRITREVGVTMRWEPGGQARILAIASIPQAYPGDDWQPIDDSCLRWGPMNCLARDDSSSGRLHSLSVEGEVSPETRLVENVVSLASPAIASRSSERLILFSLHDPNKPWFAGTDIGTLRQVDDQPWVLDRIADDQAAEFGPSAVTADSGMILAAWERVSGDVSDTNEPAQVSPHVEVVAAWSDPTTGLWSTPEQLTFNGVVDHRPIPIALGATHSILWLQNEGTAAVGDANSGDRLMLTTWSDSGWNEPQTLWSPQKNILDFAFVADGSGEGQVVLTVDEDGDPNTTADCELYLLFTANGAWQTAIQLTSDFVEDAMPTLVVPDGVPMCVWSADGTLVYSLLYDWNPRQVYGEYTLANKAPSLDSVTMPGGVAVAYTVQGPNGVDVVASFYDADLDRWSLPRELTADEHAETALSLIWDANELVIAYLKTQTLREDMDVEIDGQMQHLENIPQPGRTDLYVLRHALANDLAVVSESVVLDPANPAPGTAATIHATIESRGDLPLQNVEVAFYDGDPSNGGVPVGERQVIPGTLIAGARENVSVSWNVPSEAMSRRIFVVVDPCLVIDDRDRSNNERSWHTVLPDLAVETCRSTEVSSTTMALTARVVNTGVIPAGVFDVSWRLGAHDGEEIGTTTIESLIADGAHEATLMWDTGGHLDGGEAAQVFAVVDATGVVPEFDETNNVSSLAVFHPPVVSPDTP